MYQLVKKPVLLAVIIIIFNSGTNTLRAMHRSHVKTAAIAEQVYTKKVLHVFRFVACRPCDWHGDERIIRQNLETRQKYEYSPKWWQYIRAPERNAIICPSHSSGWRRQIFFH